MSVSPHSKWYFSKERLSNTPSRKCNVLAEREEDYRQQAASFIQQLGQRLQVTQLCINTAIVYMHRFYVFHSFTMFRRHHVSAAALFLAAKVEDQPKRLEHVVKLCYNSMNKDGPSLVLSTKCEQYRAEAQEIVSNENIILQTLGFDVAVEHPHTHVLNCCDALNLPEEFAQVSYVLATSSLHLTTLCLRFSPEVVACVCIYIANSWSICNPLSEREKSWYHFLDSSIKIEQIEILKQEFQEIFERNPCMKMKMNHSLSDIKKNRVSVFSSDLIFKFLD